ncbi:Structural maintenance of chromosomes flexible hinge domain-containing protein 1 [Bulinus truncatus]|nr:Structural maintenance of chromosomes flexible hinge domain-containing protein 1 [Bulinus truncatus]
MVKHVVTQVQLDQLLAAPGGLAGAIVCYCGIQDPQAAHQANLEVDQMCVGSEVWLTLKALVNFLKFWFSESCSELVLSQLQDSQALQTPMLFGKSVSLLAVSFISARWRQLVSVSGRLTNAKKQQQMATLSVERDSLQNTIRTYKSMFETQQQLISELRAAVNDSLKEEQSFERRAEETEYTQQPVAARLTPGSSPHDEIARVLSWHMSADMDCVVTLTTQKAKEVYQKTQGKQQVLPLDSIYRKNLPEWDKPLPHSRFQPKYKPAGNPVYARNLLEFTKDEESCRVEIHENLSCIGCTEIHENLSVGFTEIHENLSCIGCTEIHENLSVIGCTEIHENLSFIGFTEIHENLSVIGFTEIHENLSCIGCTEIHENLSCIGCTEIHENLSCIGCTEIHENLSCIGCTEIHENLSCIGCTEIHENLSCIGCTEIHENLSCIGCTEIHENLSCIGCTEIHENLFNILSCTEIHENLSCIGCIEIHENLSCIGCTEIHENLSCIGCTEIHENLSCIGCTEILLQ